MSRTRDLISGAVFIALAVATWMYSQTFPALRDGHPGPALFPQVISGFLAFAGAIVLISAIRQRSSREPKELGEAVDVWGVGRIVLAVGLASLYPVAREWVGFIPTVGFLSFAVAVLLRAPVLHALLAAVGGTALIFWIFTQLLRVPL